MRRTGRTILKVLVISVLVAGGVVGMVMLMKSRKQVTQPPPPPATQPATRPSVEPIFAERRRDAAESAGPRNMVDVIRAHYPSFPTTQPLGIPLDLREAARVYIDDPVYLGNPPLNMWITRADGVPTEELFRKPIEAQDNVIVTRERVLFVHWTPDDRGTWWPNFVVPARGGFEMISRGGRVPLGERRDYRWDRARSWNEKIIVPTASGVSVFQFDPAAMASPKSAGAKPVESHVELLDGGGSTRPSTRPAGAATDAQVADVETLLDWQGLLAYIPADRGQPGSAGAARFLDGKWTRLGPAEKWPAKLLYLIPLLDGTVMQIAPGEQADTVTLSMSNLDAADVDRKAIAKLVFQLSDDKPATREVAYNELTRYGPGIWPILQEMLDDQSPEAAARMKQLLKSKDKPMLGGMRMLGDHLVIISRHADGGAIFYADEGVSIAGPDGEPEEHVPAWLAVRPGQPVTMLPDSLTVDLQPGKCSILPGRGTHDWVVTTDVLGPRRFFGNGFRTLLKKDEQPYKEFAGLDSRGRWLFRKPGDSLAASRGAEVRTLIVDPTLPDATPRLPIWNFNSAQEAGWDKEGWPAVRWEGGLTRLKEGGWEPIKEGEPFHTKAEEAPVVSTPVSAPPVTRPTTSPSTRPATARTAIPDELSTGEKPIFVASNGTRYYGGVEDLRVITTTGERTVWPLPPIAHGEAPAHLAQSADGVLFLFNQPGRVLRIRATPDALDPFTIDATFTRNIPFADKITRVWIDPAGRLIMAHENRLAIMFPAGYIPDRIRQLMVDPDEDDF